MRTVLDSSIILNVLTDAPDWADASEVALVGAMQQGGLVIGECVLAEITPALEAADLDRFFAEWNISYIPTSRQGAIAAGKMYASYLGRGGVKKRVLPDFLIGAHAMENGGRLLARDRGYYRDYFDGLQVIEPLAR
jgi:predicted nucleic acid-binding protein